MLDANHAVLREPQHQVVVEGAARHPLVATLEAAAVQVKHDGSRDHRRSLRREDVECVERIGAVAHVARQGHVRIGFALRCEQRLVERLRIRDVDDRSDPA
jgi:hypothetical protein